MVIDVIIKIIEIYIGCLEYLYIPFVNGLSRFVFLSVYITDKSIISPNVNIVNPM